MERKQIKTHEGNKTRAAYIKRPEMSWMESIKSLKNSSLMVQNHT